MKKKSVTKKIKFSELMKKYPESIEILFDKGMHCIGCGMASEETLEEGCIAHGLDPEKIVKEINNKIKKETK